MLVGSNHAAGDGDATGDCAGDSFDGVESVLGVEAAKAEDSVDYDDFGGAVKLVCGPFAGGAVHGNEGNAHKRGLGWQLGNGPNDGNLFDKQCKWGGAQFHNAVKNAPAVVVLSGLETDSKGLDDLVVVGEYVGSHR